MVFHRKFWTDVTVWVLATPLAFLVRFDFMWRDSAWPGLLALVALGLPLKVFVVRRLRLHHQSWRTVTFRDVGLLVRAVGAVAIVLFLAGLVLSQFVAIPRSAPIIEGALRRTK